MAQPNARPTIALAACGAVSALGVGIEPLTRALVNNASGLRPCQRLAGKGYQSAVVGAIEDSVMVRLRDENPTFADARAFLLADAALRQVEQNIAGSLNELPASRRGLVLSTTKADVEALERTFRREPCSAAARRHVQPAWLAADLAAARGVSGPVQCVSVACISGLLALKQGAALIRRDLADLVYVVGVDLLSPFVLSGFTSLKSLDPDGCRPFDRGRLGLSLGEGAGAVALVRGDLASPGSVWLRGWGVSDDANHLTGPARDGSGLAAAIRRALDQAGLPAGNVDYAHMHGTGTPYNDAMESLALRSVFGERTPPFGSSKGMLGHTLGAAGVLETILCWVALKSRLLPGTPRLREPDPIAPDSLLTLPKPVAELRAILKVNCGFGGTNGAMVLAKGD